MTQSPAEISVRKAEQEWNAAIAKQDPDAARRFLDEEYVLVGMRSTGVNSVHRDQWLRALAEMEIRHYRAEPTRVRVYGDSAVVSVEGDWHIIFQGHEIDEKFLLTDVWVKVVDTWKVVLRHSSPYPRITEDR